MKNVFIDSNIWLSLYAFSSDDLEQFSKLSGMVNRDINIFLPEQVVDEYRRNREAKIKESLRQYKEWKLEVPNICKGYKEYLFLPTPNVPKQPSRNVQL